jgi:hypothetical protein
LTCREKLQEALDAPIIGALARNNINEAREMASFLFCTTVDFEIFANVLAIVERHIGVSSLSTIVPTSVKHVMRICPNQFWASSIMRMSFLTIVARAIHQNFATSTKDNFSENWYNMLLQQPYFTGTHAATKLFLAGHTYNDNYIINSGQWVSAFREATTETAAKVLLNPTHFTHEQYRGLVEAAATRLARANGYTLTQGRNTAEIICAFAARR